MEGTESESRKVVRLGKILADGLREGMEMPPPESPEEVAELMHQVQVNRFPTFEEIDAELWRRIEEEHR